MRLATVLLLAGCSVQYKLADVVLVQPAACINLDVLQRSLDDWNNAVGSRFVLSAERPTATLEIACAPILDEPSDAAADWDYAGHITILQEWADAPAAKLEGLYVHELGHTLGAVHDQGETSAMFWVAHTFDGIGADDAADVSCAQEGTGCALAQPDPTH